MCVQSKLYEESSGASSLSHKFDQDFLPVGDGFVSLALPFMSPNMLNKDAC